MNGLVLNTALLKVPLYVAGNHPEQVGQTLGLREILRLGSNENALGPSPMAVAALRDAITQVHRYPGIADPELRKKLALYYGGSLTPYHFVLGNGATDILRMVAQAFISDGSQSIVASVTFPLFALLTTMFGGTPVRVKLRCDYSYDLSAMLNAITPQTRLIWLCSPNNPTGLILSQRETDEFLDSLPPHIVVVFDEAYCDYVTDPAGMKTLRYVEEGRNVIIVRSFSKMSGLAGLRVGYGIASPEMIEYLLHAVLPFNTNTLALIAASASLDDVAFHCSSRELVQRERRVLFEGLSEMGLKCLPSQANFILIVDPTPNVPALVEALLQEAIIVRPMACFGLANAVRVTVGLPEDNQRFLQTLRTLLGSIRGVAAQSSPSRLASQGICMPP